MLGGYFGNQPVLTVIKDGFVIDTICLDGRDTLLVGRSSDCDIVVGHCSTSRQHLEIQVIRATQELVLTDLASGHGTCINGKKIQPLVPAVAKENDIIQLAASTRAYKVQWVPPLSLDEVCEPSSSLETQPPFGSKSFPVRKGQERGKNTVPRSRWDKEENGVSESPSRTPQRGLQRGRSLQKRSANEENELPFSPQRTPQKENSELPPRAPPRRLAFSSLQASAINARSPSVRKASAEKGSVLKQQTPPRAAGKEQAGTLKKAQTNLWLRRCNSAPLPALQTSAPQQDGQDAVAPDGQGVEVEIDDADAALLRICQEQIQSEGISTLSSQFLEEAEEEYDSDKENVLPQSYIGGGYQHQQGEGDIYNAFSSRRDEGAERKPFQPLPIAPDQDFEFQSSSPSEVNTASTLGLPRLRLPRPAAAKNLDQMFRRMTLADADKRQWHMVVDTSCLLSTESLKLFKQLEGNKDTRIIIPRIVIRELDSLKNRHNLSHVARTALNWINSCMTTLPTWIHVQNSSETGPVTVTPPADPVMLGRVHHDIMSPTNDDHILECALLFDKKIRAGRVALLTRDTALKIKAMAEGLVADNEADFIESLMSPYSERFLWAGSKAHGKTWTEGPNSPKPSPTISPLSRLKNSKKLPSPISGLRHHYNEQPKGLRLVLA